MVFRMAKTLVIAEKPSVGRDLATALDGPFQRRKLEDVKPKRTRKKAEEPTNEEVVDAAKSKTKSRTTRDEAVFLESDDYVITWAVGHLVQLAEPEEYDEKWKKWKMADLPIVPPNGFKLVPRDAKSKKQLKLRGRRQDHQRLRRGSRRRADLRVRVRVRFRQVRHERTGSEACRASLDLLDDEAGDPRGLREAAPGDPDAVARGSRTVPLGSGLARRDECDARRDDPRSGLGRRRRLTRPRADADARDDREAGARDSSVRP